MCQWPLGNPYIQIIKMEDQLGRSEAGFFPKLLKTGSAPLSGDYPAFFPGVCSWRHQMLWQDPERCHLRGKPILREQSQSAVEQGHPQQQRGGCQGRRPRLAGEKGRLNTGQLISFNQLPPAFVLLEIRAMFIECSLYMYHLIPSDTTRHGSSQRLLYR